VDDLAQASRLLGGRRRSKRNNLNKRGTLSQWRWQRVLDGSESDALRSRELPASRRPLSERTNHENTEFHQPSGDPSEPMSHAGPPLRVPLPSEPFGLGG